MTRAELKEKWFRDDEMPAFLGVCARTWANIKSADKIPISKRGTIKYVSVEDINKWIESNKKVDV